MYSELGESEFWQSIGLLPAITVILFLVTNSESVRTRNRKSRPGNGKIELRFVNIQEFHFVPHTAT